MGSNPILSAIKMTPHKWGVIFIMSKRMHLEHSAVRRMGIAARDIFLHAVPLTSIKCLISSLGKITLRVMRICSHREHIWRNAEQVLPIERKRNKMCRAFPHSHTPFSLAPPSGVRFLNDVCLSRKWCWLRRVMTASPNDAWLRHVLGQTSHHCGTKWSNIIFAKQMHHIAAGDASFLICKASPWFFC